MLSKKYNFKKIELKRKPKLVNSEKTRHYKLQRYITEVQKLSKRKRNIWLNKFSIKKPKVVK